jgi:GTP diphosphokinase / guanosine-3',5'-bis(diphosphate) 3'-diphosphatase
MTEKKLIPTSDYTYCETLVEEIIDTIDLYMGQDRESTRQGIEHAYRFARDAHEGQFRKSGEPYISHPLEAVKLLLKLKPDMVSIQSCILHDVIEDTPMKKADIEKEFGSEVASICEWLSKLSAIRYRWEERTIESLRKMFVAMVDDLRVIIVKLADRLHNMQTLEFHPDPAKRERIALETLNIYAPIADRLGIFDFKEALETECFKTLHPEEYMKSMIELKELREEQDFFVQKIKSIIRGVIDADTPVIDISYRIKSPYSIYRKLSRKEYSYTHARDLYDLFAVRIITDSIPHCYEILGVLHNIFVPMPKRFKDYIALPKENGYQSLHTTVVGLFPEVRSQPTEIQIRTPEMHRQAEIWVAAHFEYAESGKSSDSKDSYWVKTIKNIVDASHEGGEFMSEMKVNVFADQIFVFTPKGDIITLPKGSTPIDFAYAIHSSLGNSLTIAKINGQVVPMDYQLHNGESVHITTDVHRKPNPIWLSFVQTAKAREHIRQFINREERSFFIEKWRFILNAYLDKNYGKWLDRDFSILRHVDGKNQDTKWKEDILVQLGNLSRKPATLLKTIHDDVIASELGKRIPEESTTLIKSAKPVKKIIETNGISMIIGGEKNIPHKIAQCCNPTEKDRKIVGIIGQWVVTIHRFDCPNVKKIDLDRRIPSHWSDDTREHMITLEIECIFHDRRGVLKDLAEIIYHMNLNVKTMNVTTLESGLVRDVFTLETAEDDYYIYERVEARLQFEIPELASIRLITIE